MLTRRRAHSEDEPLEGPSRAPPTSVCTRLGLPRVYWSHKRSPHRGASLAVKVLRRSASAESILSVIPQTGDHIASTQYAFQEREPSPHAPNLRPYPRSTRSSQANTACGHTQHPAAPCQSVIEIIRVNRAWSWLYALMFTVQPGADTRARTQAQR